MGNNSSSTNLAIIFLLLLVAANLLILDLKLFGYQPPAVRISEIATVATPTPNSTPDNLCPQSCISLISEATSSSVGSPPSLYQETTISKTPPASQRKEYYIPLGTGNTTKADWDDIIASETIIDPTNYGNIKEAYFTASLRNPTQNGQVEAQLYNVTDKNPVWGSHVVMKDLKEQTIGSGEITLAKSAKLYRVQLKSTLSYQVFLDNAKIRILAE